MVGERYKYTGTVQNGIIILSEPYKNGYKTECKARCHCGEEFTVPFRHVTQENIVKCGCNGRRVYKRSHVRTRSLFDYWMSKWNPETYDPNTYKLPIFGGILGQEYIRSFCYVDKEDYEVIAKVMWIKAKEYVRANNSKENLQRDEDGLFQQVTYLFVHKLINNTPFGNLTDHKNHITYDNRKRNLRATGFSGNGVNSRVKTNFAGYRGVRKRSKNYYSGIVVKDYKHYRKFFRSRIEAAYWYDCASLYHHGEFSILNFKHNYI